jgi:glyoxylase-like metal-dependent hydrolase (beta-lactamase superfamily II)
MYTVHPIRCGTLDLPKTILTYNLDEGVTVPSPVVVFLLLPADPDDPVVVVDAGAEGGEVAGRSIPDGGPEPIRAGLAEHGVAPADVDYLVLTHLHHDHAANVDLFAESEVLLQRSELGAARDPLPPVGRAYIDAHVAALETADLTLLDGGYRLHPDLEIRHTPGHTEGMQSVVVETEGGTHALVCDLIYCRQNLQPDASEIRDVHGGTVEVTPVDYDPPYVPPGLHVSVADCYESIARMQERVGPDGVLVGAHDPAVLDGPYPRA